jgi:hypothetical protein
MMSLSIHTAPILSEGLDLLIIAHRRERAREPNRVHLVRRLPAPFRTVVGDLSETEKVLVGLALTPGA